LETNVESVFKLFKTMFLGNALTRKVFPGMADFFRTIAREGNPVFFVTSSPWNLRSFIQSVFERHQIPLGGIFMTDWGLDSEKWFCKAHDVHKTEAIKRILDWYPAKKVILIGDSGQRDPEIYVQLAMKFPDQIGMILIRNVSQAGRRGKRVQAFAEKARKEGFNFHLFESSVEMWETITREKARL
jgi:phosphatidate phosphatase APP1